ncbi:MAG TPA: glycosyl transferase family 2 [Candidatus Marinimicrobia bacterium]|nr:MAG: hypothetical protein AUJ47_10750 [Candidatus Marinimicrobia bacterium CG1_02_48_14]HCW76208.1 glycosyl transferase family 2 [Candidatus Neomarinimicrobiota bacterium]
MANQLNVVVLYNASRLDINPLLSQLDGHKVVTLATENLTMQEFSVAIKNCESESILFINASQYSISLKKSAITLFEMVAKTELNWSLIYSDYSMLSGTELQEEHLLDHHAGRLRDDTDYGFVWLLNRSKFLACLPMDQENQSSILYELRLRMSEYGRLVHVANRYSGSLYTVTKAADTQNVFAYLMAGKALQLERERVLTEHLKRLGTYLSPGQNYKTVPYHDKSYELSASVIIPVNNRPKFIGAAIESVFNQTVSDVEVIIVVNGGEADPTIPAVQAFLPGGSRYDASKPPVNLIVHDINNIGFCLNSGLEIAKGKFYVQLDSDDQLIPDCIEKIIKVYEEDDTIGMVIGSYEVWELKDSGELIRMESIPVVTHDEWTEENGRNNLLRINGAGAPRSFYIDLAKDLGLLDMNTSPYARNYGEDYHFVLRMCEQYRMGRVWEPVYKVVRHSGGTDHSINRQAVDRNNDAKDAMRLEALQRRKKMNRKT